MWDMTHWVAKNNYLRDVITDNIANQVAFEQLKEKKIIIEVELRNLKTVYSSLKDQIQGIVLLLGFSNKLLQTAYNQVDSLKQKILKEKTV